MPGRSKQGAAAGQDKGTGGQGGLTDEGRGRNGQVFAQKVKGARKRSKFLTEPAQELFTSASPIGFSVLQSVVSLRGPRSGQDKNV